MNKTIYQQSDPRWGDLPYPVDSSPVRTDGCGLLAVTHCAIEQAKNWDSTPLHFYRFMKTYAVTGNGTRWDGIDAGLNKYIGNSKRFDSMTEFFNEVAKGNRVGVILFHDGVAPDGTVWTTSGHYIAFVDAKVKNGKHYLYTKDSGWRKNDGWHCYETSMKGCIRLLWTAEVSRGGWVKDSKGWMYYDQNGNKVKDKWVKYKGEWYYLKPNGYMASNEWAKDSKGWMYMGEDGKMLKGTWLTWKGHVYYLGGDGYMVTGNRNVPASFDNDGRLITK